MGGRFPQSHTDRRPCPAHHLSVPSISYTLLHIAFPYFAGLRASLPAILFCLRWHRTSCLGTVLYSRLLRVYECTAELLLTPNVLRTICLGRKNGVGWSASWSKSELQCTCSLHPLPPSASSL